MGLFGLCPLWRFTTCESVFLKLHVETGGRRRRSRSSQAWLCLTSEGTAQAGHSQTASHLLPASANPALNLLKTRFEGPPTAYAVAHHQNAKFVSQQGLVLQPSGKLCFWFPHVSMFHSWGKKHVWLERDKISQPVNLAVPARTEGAAAAPGTHSRKNPFPSEPSDAKRPSLSLSLSRVCVCVYFCTYIYIYIIYV